MIKLTDKLLEAVRAHAAEAAPRECCGVIVVARGKAKYRPCRNLAESGQQFVIDPADYAAAEDAGEIVMIVHSHPNMAPTPSQADMVGIESTGLPWLIVNHPIGTHALMAPSGYRAPLIGREFVHGVLDCLTLIQDYFQNLGITLPQYQRDHLWWQKGQNLYLDLYQDCGFEMVDDIRTHDVVLMQIASPVPNHGGVILADGHLLHHQAGRLSSRDVYGGWYRKITTHVLRHRSLLS